MAPHFRPKTRSHTQIFFEAGEMTKWLRALAALPEDPSSVPSLHMVAHKYL